MTEGITEIINKILDILALEPLVFSIALPIIILFFIWIFKDVLGLWLRKITGTYNLREIEESIKESIPTKDSLSIEKVVDNEEISETILSNLKHSVK